MDLVMTVLISGMTIGAIWLLFDTFGLVKRPNVSSTEEIIAIIDERILYHAKNDEREHILFGNKESVWNAPYYAKLKGEVSEHLREAELDSAIILIEKQRLKQLEIEELKLRLEMYKKGEKQ